MKYKLLVNIYSDMWPPYLENVERKRSNNDNEGSQVKQTAQQVQDEILANKGTWEIHKIHIRFIGRQGNCSVTSRRAKQERDSWNAAHNQSVYPETVSLYWLIRESRARSVDRLWYFRWQAMTTTMLPTINHRHSTMFNNYITLHQLWMSLTLQNVDQELSPNWKCYTSDFRTSTKKI